ncbi:MAG: hypothetical protein WDM70_03885 [Nitrosomonadales bacterium]
MPFKHLSLPLAALFAVTLVACGKTETPAATPADTATNSADELLVKIGASAPLTGPQAHIGKDNENGTRMAIRRCQRQRYHHRRQESAFRIAQRRRPN